MPNIPDNLRAIHERIQVAAQDCARDPAEITLLAVSKRKPVTAILEAYEAGQKCFGENYVQEGLEKIAELSHLPIEWHYIGAIQSNKTRQIAEHFDWVHGLSSIKHARRLSDQRPGDRKPLNVCIQVNISNEDSKSGIQLQEVERVAGEIAQLKHLHLRGLMALPSPSADPAVQANEFGRMQELFNALNDSGLHLDTLSMGMSNDLEMAIRYGATIVRIGTAIFGARD